MFILFCLFLLQHENKINFEFFAGFIAFMLNGFVELMILEEIPQFNEIITLVFILLNFFPI